MSSSGSDRALPTVPNSPVDPPPEKAVRRADSPPPVSSARGSEARAASASLSLSTDTEELEQDGPGSGIARNSPPWMVSTVIHALVLIVLAFVIIRQEDKGPLDISLAFSERLGKQLETEVETPAEEPEEEEEPAEIEIPLPEVPEPAATVEQTAVEPEPQAPSPPRAEIIASSLLGRDAGQKEALLAAYGGDATTEAAVRQGLLWLKRFQRSNGSWSLSDPYSHGSRSENIPAATAMALLAFQGAGHTHFSGEFKRQVAKGKEALLAMQTPEGDFFPSRGKWSHRMYTHAQCTIVLCELYGMTRDESLREPAKRAVTYCIGTQSEEGGWRYYPGTGADTSVTGWFMMALQSARMAGLEVPATVFERMGDFLDTVAVDNGSRYLYMPGTHGTLAVTAEGLLCRQYLGWAASDARLLEGADYLLENPIDWNQRNVYYWYYATQVLHHLGGSHWKQWNDTMKSILPQEQVRTGRERGSWHPHRPTPDEWGLRAGRLYVTCLSLYMLEVYYRHLPLYGDPHFVTPAN